MNKLITICALVCLYGCKSTTIDTDSFNMPESYYKEFYGRLSAQAYDFEAENVDGKVIYYRINSNNNVYVTAHGDARLQYTGTIRIPEEVTYQGMVYKVKGLVSSEDEFPDIGYLFKALPPFSGGCPDLKEVVLPATIDNIGSYSFFLCSDLKTIRLPSTIRYLGDCVFGYCQSLTRFYINSAKPPQTHERCFDLFSPAQCTLYVPKGCKARYQQAEGWKDFKKIVEQ